MDGKLDAKSKENRLNMDRIDRKSVESQRKTDGKWDGIWKENRLKMDGQLMKNQSKIGEWNARAAEALCS